MENTKNKQTKAASVLRPATGSISWQRWSKPVTYKWTFKSFSILSDGGYWKLYRKKELLFGDQDLQVVQDWAANYIKSNK